ncbi:MAG TPA: chaperone modulator CbpM [Alcanivorax sp.]|nr:chaperone modulator CbpM [Alcanivorax sp.]
MNTLTLTELCRRVSLPEHAVIEIVEVGIIEPLGGSSTWRFDDRTLVVLSRAARLHEDLHLDWPGVALALELLEEIGTLRRENEQLRQRLNRFLD